MELLHALKFEHTGLNSVSERRQNVVEQLYRTFKMMTILAGAESLLEEHRGIHLTLDFGLSFSRAPTLVRTLSDWRDLGPPFNLVERYLYVTDRFDIDSRDNKVAAQAFAATSEGSNSALRKNCERIMRHPAQCRYVFFYTPNERPGRRDDLERRMSGKIPEFGKQGIEIWALPYEAIM